MSTLSRWAMGSVALALLAALTGCKSSRNDAAFDEPANRYNEVGEQRVFESPKKVAKANLRINEAVPAPAPMKLAAVKHRQIVGELDMDN